MKPLPLRISSTLAALGLAALALAQDQPAAEKTTETTQQSASVFSNVSSVSNGWWIATLLATAILGSIVGYVVYRSFVSKGQAGKATGCGCLTGVVVFLLAQVIVAFVLITTVMARIADQDAKVDSKTTKVDQKQPVTPEQPAKTTGETPTTPATDGGGY